LSIVLDRLFVPIDRAWLAIRRRWARASARASKTVSLRAHGSVTVDMACDFTGDTCLRTNLLTKMTLDHAAPGSVMEITTDNLASVETIPFMLSGHGCVHIATVRTGTDWKIYVRKQDIR
jgi:TusA-related sulfurtransferase